MDEFGKEALVRIAQRQSGSRAKAVAVAWRHYLSERDAGRPAWRVPKLPAPAGPHAVHLVLDADLWQSIVDEAEAQGVTPELLTLHALLFYVADVDSGRVVA